MHTNTNFITTTITAPYHYLIFLSHHLLTIIIITSTASPSSSTARRSSSSAHSISNKFSTKKPRFFLLHRTCSGLLLVPMLSRSITWKHLLHLNCAGHQTQSKISLSQVNFRTQKIHRLPSHYRSRGRMQ